MFGIALVFAVLSIGLGFLAFGVSPTTLRTALDAAFLASVACFLLSMTGGFAQRLHRSFRADVRDLDERVRREPTNDRSSRR